MLSNYCLFYFTDHAWGGNYFLLGGDLDGGQIHGNYPAKLGEENGDVNIGRGRMLPTTSWNSLWKPVAEWFGILPTEMDAILPNQGKFPNVLGKTDVFK
tara:strand:- start:290 stop:586 length:297 start_codon:yes stop_codon:yes gene_type:complete